MSGLHFAVFRRGPVERAGVLETGDQIFAVCAVALTMLHNQQTPVIQADFAELRDA
jgi:hypothetical protein